MLDPCSWPCSKPVPLERGVAGHAWLSHPWSGETESGRRTLHQRWSSPGGQWTDLTVTERRDLQESIGHMQYKRMRSITVVIQWVHTDIDMQTHSKQAIQTSPVIHAIHSDLHRNACKPILEPHHTDLALQRGRGVCQSRRALRGRLPRWKQSAVAEKEPGTPANIAYFTSPNSKLWKRVVGAGVPVASTSMLRCTVSWHWTSSEICPHEGNQHAPRRTGSQREKAPAPRRKEGRSEVLFYGRVATFPCRSEGEQSRTEQSRESEEASLIWTSSSLSSVSGLVV